ncbi:hypothetical protein HRTV-25_gp100 [Halorubrum tailed virus 25]|uniref:Uncharacterized protein n=1 Tax=Halorubrum tailed virus 25 TaxID=2878006 RepID=A0AAE8XYD6_9CAUD|nr:hypothetical protein M1M37_gp100 [Halorubrum tailed virus 25]UBF22681.1 hypothetical protein HRTV-25_gp100 [Halorubrum tailed virus 25]
MTDNTISKLYNSVNLIRGLGYSGKRVTIEDMECKVCSYDRLLRVEHVHPETPSDVEYYCRHPNCPDHERASKFIPRL